VLVFGCGYRRIADATCSATTLRRRRDEWIRAGVAEQLRRAVLAAYHRLLGLELEHLAVDGCITKAPCGGQVAGPSPVDRRKQGLKRSVAVEAGGIPLGMACRHRSALPACRRRPLASRRDLREGCWPVALGVPRDRSVQPGHRRVRRSASRRERRPAVLGAGHRAHRRLSR
jgi:hypothetical protein